jgi:hypothetical protein
VPFAKTTFVQGTAPAATAAELNNFGDGIVEAQRAPWVTALPTTGPGGGALVDGQECYFKPDPTNSIGNPGVAWHLKYDGGSGKWFCIGGTPVIFSAPVASSVDITNTAYGAAFTSSPSYTVPFPGIFRVHFGHCGFATGQISMLMAPCANGVAPPNEQTDAVQAGYGVANVDQYGVARTTNVSVLTAGHVIDLRARVSSGTGKMRQPWMEVMPVRIG